jgi:hypothetical protein
MTQPVPATNRRDTIVPTNPTPQQATPLAAIEQAVNEATGQIPFLDYESKRTWAERAYNFYVTAAEFEADGRFGAGWVLTLYPQEGGAVRMSFHNTGGSRDELLARIADHLPVGPCRLVYKELAGGKEFFTLCPA